MNPCALLSMCAFSWSNMRFNRNLHLYINSWRLNTTPMTQFAARLQGQSCKLCWTAKPSNIFRRRLLGLFSNHRHRSQSSLPTGLGSHHSYQEPLCLPWLSKGVPLPPNSHTQPWRRVASNLRFNPSSDCPFTFHHYPYLARTERNNT